MIKLGKKIIFSIRLNEMNRAYNISRICIQNTIKLNVVCMLHWVVKAITEMNLWIKENLIYSIPYIRNVNTFVYNIWV